MKTSLHKDELQDKELWLTSRQFLQIADDIKEKDEILQVAQENEAGQSSKISELEAGLEKLKADLAECENGWRIITASSNEGIFLFSKRTPEIRKGTLT